MLESFAKLFFPQLTGKNNIKLTANKNPSCFKEFEHSIAKLQHTHIINNVISVDANIIIVMVNVLGMNRHF